jgi:hypothetical protein
MKIAFILVILVVLIISGCIETGMTNIKDVVQNPENYLDKTITASGTLGFRPSSGLILAGIYAPYAIFDEEGYYLLLKPFEEEGREFTLFGQYKVTGKLKFVDICDCEDSGLTKTVSNCTNCLPNSTKTIYYFEGTEPMVKV